LFELCIYSTKAKVSTKAKDMYSTKNIQRNINFTSAADINDMGKNGFV